MYILKLVNICSFPFVVCTLFTDLVNSPYQMTCIVRMFMTYVMQLHLYTEMGLHSVHLSGMPCSCHFVLFTGETVDCRNKIT
jgi:hypothetical protein